MRTLPEILAEISALGPMLPGSIRKTTQLKKDKNGNPVRYTSSPIYTYTDIESGRQRHKRVNPKLYERVKELTAGYAQYRKLLKEYDEALISANYPCGAKKN